MVDQTQAAKQAATLEKFIKGWAKWTPESFLESWADGCTQQNLPFSYKSEVKTRDTVEKLFPVLMSILTNFELTVHNVVHDVANGKAVIYALATADAPWGPYSNEHALFLWFDESGEKVIKIEELFDTVVMQHVLPKIHQIAKEKEAAGTGGVGVTVSA